MILKEDKQDFKKKVMGTNLILAATILLMLGVTPSVYAHTQDYMKGYETKGGNRDWQF